MPTYTLKDIKTQETFDVRCSWNDLRVMLNEQPDLVQVPVAPATISGRSGGMRVPDGFRDLQKQIKRGSGKGNTINV